VIAAIEEIHVHPRPSVVNPLPRNDHRGPDAEQRSDHALMLAVRDGELDALGTFFEATTARSSASS